MGAGKPSTDPDYAYTPEEERRLAENLRAITERVYRNEFKAVPLAPDLLCHFHGNLFSSVRPHAGRHRSVDFGSETLTYGPHRSVHRSEVKAKLEQVFNELRRSVGSLEANPEDANYEPSALRVGAWVHAQLIRIHPFQDGNGRTCRLLMNCVLLRVGLLPIRLEVPKQEYLACLNHYYITGDIRPLEDLCLQLYAIELGLG